MSLETLFIIFIIEASVLFGLLWFVTKLKYFAGMCINSAVIFTLFFMFYKYISKEHPEYLDNVAIKFFEPYFQKYLPIIVTVLGVVIVCGIVICLLFFFVFRHVIAKISQMMFKMKIRIFDEKKQKVVKISFDIKEYFRYGKYFIGLNSKRKPLYLDEKQMTMHIQVVGPSGVGKTVSVLFPLAIQCLLNDVSLIFVDGKGDAKLKHMFISFCKSINKKMYFFDTLQPEYSHSYNPLIGSSDANEITNLLAVGLNLNAPGEAKVYTDIQKKFLATLLHIFVETGEKFNFVDIVEFINHRVARDIVYQYIKNEFYKTEMVTFLSRLSKNERELIGLATVLDQLFVADEKISELVNTYEPYIDIREILKKGDAVLFSFSAGMKAQTNEALAKMVLADIANAVGQRHAETDQNQNFAMIILDEFGQYVSESFDKFISTARSANISCILSHQSNAQLETFFSKDKLARVVRENTAGKLIFRQSEEADFWASCFGTRTTMKRTEQVETGALLTEKVSQMGSLREVDEFLIHPNTLRKLQIGQAVFKYGERDPEIVSLGVYDSGKSDVKLEKIEKKNGVGLYLRQKRIELLKEKQKEKQIKSEETITIKKGVT